MPRWLSLAAIPAIAAYVAILILAFALLGFLAVLLANVVDAIASSLAEAPAATAGALLVLSVIATVIALSGRTNATQPPLRRDAFPVDKPMPWPGSGVL